MESAVLSCHGSDLISPVGLKLLSLVILSHALFQPSDRDPAIYRMKQCVKDIKAWAVINKLQFNDQINEVLRITRVLSTLRAFKQLKSGTLLLIHALTLAISELSFEVRISNVLRAGWACIYKLVKIRRYLNKSCAEKLVHVFITWRLDSCNSLLADHPTKQI